MDVHSYIVYGEAVPDGNCWFVARRCKVNGYLELWNPMTAECYNFDRIETTTKQAVGADAKSTSTNMRLFDPTCTMKRVWCVVGQDNIWANIQPEDAPVLMNFNLEDKKSWKPFLDDKLKAAAYGGRAMSSLSV